MCQGVTGRRGGGGAVLHSMVRKGLSDEGTSEQRPEAKTRQKATGPPGHSDKGNRVYGGPEAKCLACPFLCPLPLHRTTPGNGIHYQTQSALFLKYGWIKVLRKEQEMKNWKGQVEK